MNMTSMDIAKTSIPQIVARIHRSMSTGELVVESRSRGMRKLNFWYGHLLAIRVDDPARRWGQWLLEKNLISPWDMDLALTQVKNDAAIGLVLSRMGLVGEHELRQHLQDWMFNEWKSVCETREGNATWNPTDVRPDVFILPDLSTGDWIARVIRELPEDFPLRNYLPGSQYLSNPRLEDRIIDAHVYKAEKLLFEAVASGQPLETVANRYHLETHVVERITFLFLTLGWIVPAQPSEDKDVQKREEIFSTTGTFTLSAGRGLPDPKQIMETALSMQTMKPHEVLGVSPDAGIIDIAKRYQEKFQIYHPAHYIGKVTTDPNVVKALIQIQARLKESYMNLSKPVQPYPSPNEGETSQPSTIPHEDSLSLEHAQTAYRTYSEARQLLMKGEARGAVQLLEQAIRLKSDEALYWERLGDAYVNMQEWKKAENAYKKAWKLQPLNIDIPLSLARLYWQFDKPALAAKWAREALNLDPSNVQVQKLIALLDNSKKERTKKTPFWKRFIRN